MAAPSFVTGDSRGLKATGVIIRPAVITTGIIPATVMTVEAGDERWPPVVLWSFGVGGQQSEELIRWLRWRLGCSTPVCKTAVFLLSCRAGGGRYGAGGSGVRLPATVDVALLVLA